jgi:hypothetical protein
MISRGWMRALRRTARVLWWVLFAALDQDVFTDDAEDAAADADTDTDDATHTETR